MGSEIDYTDLDVVNVLAMPLWRWDNRSRYRTAGGWDGSLRRAVYSNGTEHGFATESAETMLELGPFLRRVLEAGVRELEADPDFQAYLTALYAGDHDRIVDLELVASTSEANQ